MSFQKCLLNSTYLNIVSLPLPFIYPISAIFPISSAQNPPLYQTLVFHHQLYILEREALFEGRKKSENKAKMGSLEPETHISFNGSCNVTGKNLSTDSVINLDETKGKMGSFEPETRISNGRCNGTGMKLSTDSVINFDRGDPTMYESFWQEMGQRSTIVISGSQSMSYFSDVRNICWFMEPELAQEIKKLHQLVGNAETKDRHIIVGTGSSQLIQAALYALSPSDASEPMNVVSAVPYYSSYPPLTDYLRSKLYRWAGDAYTFNEDAPYIEFVTSPNNPDGSIRKAVVNKSGGKMVHDLAYYWPQYTPISSAADHDLMLFAVSKCTGHAGTRIGWALVKDVEVAKKMIKFIELNTIGVSKDSQLRAAKIIHTVCDGYEGGDTGGVERFFEYGHRLMTERWERLREALRESTLFSLPEFQLDFCNFTGEIRTTLPAFAWLKCEGDIEDLEMFLKSNKILTRSGKHCGADPKYVRVSMVDRDEIFNLFVKRLSVCH
ncbi:L-tryptophan--pyruvate aminotransferase 1-like [Tasmannia lanceolata]|uniref:L-tryptophan--pyruvate aminotransferase 1-like n=1 Tax=Tasmannia lanceolata TaxID=3420 RepID=UPI0040629496